MLLEIALADSYGIGFEFVPSEGDTRPNNGRQYYQNPKYLDLMPGCYTDDTQRSLANVCALIDGDPLSIWTYADAYVTTFQHDPRNGYSRRYQTFLESVKTADEFIATIDTSAESNGSIMGVLPLGYLPTAGQVRAAAAAQAMTTHAHTTVPYAQSLALMAHYYIYRDNYADQYPDAQSFHRANMFWPNGKTYSIDRKSGPVKMTAHDTWCAVMGLQRYDNLLTMLRAAVDLRGDTDSVAALAVGLASLSPNVENNLPKSLYDGLEGKPFGRDYLVTHENMLRKKFQLPLL